MASFNSSIAAGIWLIASLSPATAAVTIYTNEAAFDAAVAQPTSYVPVANAFFASSYALGPVTISTNGFLTTYTGDYGPGVKEVGAFESPVVFSSTTTALGLELGYFIGPAPATYTVDGVSGTITVPDNNESPNTTFIGFVSGSPIQVSFATNSAEFDTIRAVAGNSMTNGVPEPSTWAMMLLGFAGLAFIGYRKAHVSCTPLTVE